jgi:hypothetical protein
VNSRFAGTVDERLWRLISCYAARGLTRRAELRGAPALQLSNAQRLLNVPVKSVQPDFLWPFIKTATIPIPGRMHADYLSWVVLMQIYRRQD